MLLESSYRSKALTNLGFETYGDYLNSNLWKVIKYHILDRDVRYCRGRKCNTKTTEVHHLTYIEASLSGQIPHVLLTLCPNCQDKVNYDNGVKRSIADMAKATLEMMTDTKIVKGVSNPIVGRWFKNQMSVNTHVVPAIQKDIDRICYGIQV